MQNQKSNFSISKEIIFRFYALGMFLVAIYHFLGLFQPTWIEPSPVERHLIFIGINLLLVFLMSKRPWFLLWILVPLTLQQTYSHGIQMIDIWQVRKEIDWNSILVIVALPVLIGLVWRERRLVSKRNF